MSFFRGRRGRCRFAGVAARGKYLTKVKLSRGEKKKAAKERAELKRLNAAAKEARDLASGKKKKDTYVMDNATANMLKANPHMTQEEAREAALEKLAAAVRHAMGW